MFRSGGSACALGPGLGQNTGHLYRETSGVEKKRYSSDFVGKGHHEQMVRLIGPVSVLGLGNVKEAQKWGQVLICCKRHDKTSPGDDVCFRFSGFRIW